MSKLDYKLLFCSGALTQPLFSVKYLFEEANIACSWVFTFQSPNLAIIREKRNPKISEWMIATERGIGKSYVVANL